MIIDPQYLTMYLLQYQMCYLIVAHGLNLTLAGSQYWLRQAGYWMYYCMRYELPYQEVYLRYFVHVRGGLFQKFFFLHCSNFETIRLTMCRNGNFGLVFVRGEILLTFMIFVYHWTSQVSRTSRKIKKAKFFFKGHRQGHSYTY